MPATQQYPQSAYLLCEIQRLRTALYEIANYGAPFAEQADPAAKQMQSVARAAIREDARGI